MKTCAYVILNQPMGSDDASPIQLYFPIASAQHATHAGLPVFFGDEQHEGETDNQTVARAVAAQTLGRLTLPQSAALHLLHSDYDNQGNRMNFYTTPLLTPVPQALGALPAGQPMQAVQQFLAGRPDADSPVQLLTQLYLMPTPAYVASPVWRAWQAALAWARGRGSKRRMMTADGASPANDLIPGVGWLGYSVNLVTSSQPSNVLARIVDLNTGSGKDTSVTFAGVTYSVPDNVSYQQLIGGELTFNSYATRHEYSSHLAVSAQVKGSGWGFKGQFDASYTDLSENESVGFYGLVESNATLWALALNSLQTPKLVTEFAQDLALLPPSFGPGSQHIFFDFFTKYGTHIITSVQMGGSFTYESTISSSMDYNKKTATANLELEYMSVVKDASASLKAKSDWDKMNKDWIAERKAKVTFQGGDLTLIGSVVPPGVDFNPAEDANYQDVVTKWAASAQNAPTVVSSHLQPICNVAPSTQFEALTLALDAYLNGGISVSSKAIIKDGVTEDGAWSILVGTTAVKLEHPPVSSEYALYWIVLVDNLGAVQFNESSPSTDPAQLDQLVQHAQEASNGQIWWVAVLLFAPAVYAISAKSQLWLQECGIVLPGAGTQKWPNQVTAIGRTNSPNFGGVSNVIDNAQGAASGQKVTQTSLSELPLHVNL